VLVPPCTDLSEAEVDRYFEAWEQSGSSSDSEAILNSAKYAHAVVITLHDVMTQPISHATAHANDSIVPRVLHFSALVFVHHEVL